MYLSRFSFVPASLACSAVLAATASPQELDGAPRPYSSRTAVQPSTSALSVAYEYLRDGTQIADDSLGVGYGVDIDPVSGELVLKSPVFTVTTPLGDDTACTGTDLMLASHLSTGSSLRHATLEAGLSGGFGPVKAAAALSTNDLSGSTDLRTGISLVCESHWAPKVVDLTNPSSFQFTPQAIQVLTTPNLSAGQRGALWRSQFGRFIIVGYGFTGSVGVEISLSQQATFQEKNTIITLEAQYASASGNAAIGLFTKEALTQGSVSVNRRVVGTVPPGVTLPDIPNLQTLSTLDGPTAFGVAIETAVRQIKRRQGIYIQPATSLPFGTYAIPAITIGSWDLIVQSNASGIADHGLRALMDASAWLHPFSLRSYLAGMTSSTTGASLVSDLESGSIELLGKLDNLYRAVVAYEADTTNDALRNALSAATQSVVPSITALENSTNQVRDICSALPPMTLNVFEDDFEYNCNTAAAAMPKLTRWFIQGIALFPRDSESPEQAFSRLLNTDNKLRLDVPGSYCYPYTPGWVDTYANGGIVPVTVLHVDRIMTGPSKGLWNVSARIIVKTTNHHFMHEASIRDELGRFATDSISTLQNNSPVWE